MTAIASGARLRLATPSLITGRTEADGRYDPSSNTWLSGPALHTGRFTATATTLPDGRILITDGTPYWEPSFGLSWLRAPAEILDPSTSGDWVETGLMNFARMGSAATLLPGGQVLVTGVERPEVFRAPWLLTIAEPVITAGWSGSATVSATLYTNGVGMTGKMVNFALSGEPVGGPVMTDAQGVATLSISVAGLETGTYAGAILASVAGDSDVPACTAATDLQVNISTQAVTWAPDWTPPWDALMANSLGTAGLNAILQGHVVANVAGDWAFRFIGGSPCIVSTPVDLDHYAPVTRCADFQAVWTYRSAPVVEAEIPTCVGCSGVWGSLDGTAGGVTIDQVHNVAYVQYVLDCPECVGGSASPVAILDGTTNVVIGTIPLRWGDRVGRAGLMAVDTARSRLYVVDQYTPDSGALLWTIDSGTRTVIGATPIPYDGTWTSFAFNPSTGFAYLTGSDPDGLTVLDPAHPLESLVRVPIPHTYDPFAGTVSAVAVDPVTNMVYVGSSEGIYAVGGDPTHLTSFNVVSPLGLPTWGGQYNWRGTWDLAVNPHTSLVYAMPRDYNDSGFLGVYDGNPAHPEYGTLVNSMSLATSGVAWNVGYSQTYGLAVNPVTNIAYLKEGVYDGGGGVQLIAIDLATNAVASATPLPLGADQMGISGRVSVNPETGRIYETAGRSYLFSFVVLRDHPPAEAITPIASGPTIVAVAQVAITFANVTAGGTTTVAPVDPAALNLQVPGQFAVDNALAYEVTTTAHVGFPATLCFNASSVTSPELFAALHVLHGENGVLVDRTVSRDFATGTVCATVNSLSPFVVASSTATMVAGGGQISDLIAALQQASPRLGPGLAISLGTKLKAANASLAKGKMMEAIAKLDAFAVEVRTERGKNKPKLTADQAQAFLATLGRVRTAIRR